MNWENKTIDLGSIKENSKKTVIFNADTLDGIVSTNTSCGCSQATIDKDNNRIVISYNPGGIPYHLKNQGFSLFSKNVTVVWGDGHSDVLSFKGKIVA